jgi:mevalonate kinase
VEVLESTRRGIWIDAPEVELRAELNTLPSDHPIASAIHNFLFLWRVSPFPNLEIRISSTIPVASGLGSGAAVTVALTRALASYFNHPITNEEVNAFAYEIEKLHHGTPSGIDNTVITYARPVYFIKGNPIETFHVGKPFTIVIADTGIRAHTKDSVGDVRKLWESDRPKWERVFDQVGGIAQAARELIEKGNTDQLGRLMDLNHDLLEKMTVSSPELDTLIAAAREAGALGAKLSGGGRGGNMIALAPPKLAEEISRSLHRAGAQHTIISRVS